MPIDILEKLNMVLNTIKDEALMISKIKKAHKWSFIRNTVSKIRNQSNWKKFFLFGDREAGSQNLTWKKTLNERGNQVKRLLNFPLYRSHTVRKIFWRNNTEAVKTFFHTPMRAYNLFLWKYEILNNKAQQYNKVFKKIWWKQEELLRKKMWFMGWILRKHITDKGETIWIGAEKFVSSMYKANWELRSDWKLSDAESKKLLNEDKP